MTTTTRRLITGAMAIMLLSAPLSHAFACNASLDGQRSSPRPDATTTVEEAQKITSNGPSLDGQRISPRPENMPPFEEAQKITTNGTSLAGSRVDLRKHAAR